MGFHCAASDETNGLLASLFVRDHCSATIQDRTFLFRREEKFLTILLTAFRKPLLRRQVKTVSIEPGSAAVTLRRYHRCATFPRPR